MSEIEAKPFIGAKLIHAYPEESEGGDAGYHVIYSWGTTDEYHSWSPKHVFEKAYRELDEPVNTDERRAVKC